MASLINSCRNFSCQEFRAAYRTEFKKDSAQHILIIIGVASYILFCVGWNWCKAININLVDGATFTNPHIAAWTTVIGASGMSVSVCGALILKIVKTCNRMNRPVIPETANQNGHVDN